jgi:hypothetical protein
MPQNWGRTEATSTCRLPSDAEDRKPAIRQE